MVLVATTTIGGIGTGDSWKPLIAVDCYIARTTARFETIDDSKTSVGVVVVVPRSRWDDRPVLRDWIGFLGFRKRASTKRRIPELNDGDNAVVNAGADDGLHHRRTWCVDSDYRYPLLCGILCLAMVSC